MPRNNASDCGGAPGGVGWLPWLASLNPGQACHGGARLAYGLRRLPRLPRLPRLRPLRGRVASLAGAPIVRSGLLLVAQYSPPDTTGGAWGVKSRGIWPHRCPAEPSLFATTAFRNLACEGTGIPSTLPGCSCLADSTCNVRVAPQVQWTASPGRVASISSKAKQCGQHAPS